MAGKNAHPWAGTNLLTLLALLAVGDRAYSNCPSGWRESYASHTTECLLQIDYVDFDTAVQSCKDKGGYLVTKLDDNIIKNELTYFMEDTWVGLEDKGTGDGIKSLDGSDLPSDPYWEDEKKPAPSSNRQCVAFDPYDYIFRNKDCKEKHLALCVRKPAKCPGDWYPLAGDCIKLFTEKKSWQAANDACTNIGAKPLKIPTEGHAIALSDYLYTDPISDSDFWTGAKHIASQHKQWFDGSSVEQFMNLPLMEVNSTDTKSHCAYIRSGPQPLLNFTENCDVHRSFACFLQGDAASPKPMPSVNPNICSGGFSIVGNTCYWKSDWDSTWPEAKDHCEQLDAKLFSSYYNYGYDLYEIIHHDIFWIGMSRTSDNVTFQWIDGKVYNGPVSENPSQFSSMNSNYKKGNCVFVSESDSLDLYAADCDQYVRFICQKDQDLNAAPPKATDAPVISQGDCGNGWEEREGTNTCYSFIDNESHTRLEGEDECSAIGGHLASISDMDEEIYLQGRLVYMKNSEFWIGAERRIRSVLEGWRWADDSPFGYINWEAGEPRDGNLQIYAILHKSTMKWTSALQTEYAAVICEKQLHPVDYHDYSTPKPQDGKYYECDEGWYGFENSCYLWSREKKTWEEAQTECQLNGADLASVRNEEENNWIWSYLQNSCEENDPKCNDFDDNSPCTSPDDLLLYSNLCPKSCGVCDGSCHNTWSDTDECEFWAGIGECKINPNFMWHRCKLSCGCDQEITNGYWIGLNSERIWNTYEWSDDSKLTFTNWNKFEPSNFEGGVENCVLIYTKKGHWADEACSQKTSGFVCKKPKTFHDDQIQDPGSTGCPAGSAGHLDKCYSISQEKEPWSYAKRACEKNNKQLAVILDASTNAFVASEIAMHFRAFKAWIGLNLNYHPPKWIDNSVLHYSANFRYSALTGGCTAAELSEIWSKAACSDKNYYICQSHRDGYATLPPTTVGPSTVAADCQGGWTGFRDKCYKLFDEEKVWALANNDCMGYGGSLVTIHDKETNDLLFKTFNVAKFKKGSGVWIGLDQQDHGSGYMWADYSAPTYWNWGKNQPRDQFHSDMNPGCAFMAKSSKWSSSSCSFSRPYVCEVVRGGLFNHHSTPYAAPVTFCNDVNHTQWREFDGACYFISDSLVDGWRAAREQCLSKGADLVSIHSKRQNDFLQDLATQAYYDKFWIGYHELGSSSYRWTDLSYTDYINWNVGEPNDAFGAEKCVALYGHNGKWNDDHCTQNAGYICEEKHYPPATVQPDISGICPSGFKSEANTNRCFYVSDDKSKTTWDEAHKACKAKNPKAELASIKGPIDQDFITLLIEESNEISIWIGYNAIQFKNQWVWVDNSEVQFTNWAPRLPRSGYYRGVNENCASVQREGSKDIAVGKWGHDSCSQKKPYVCQTQREYSLLSDPDAFADQYNSGKCNALNSFWYHERCYKFYEDEKTWDEARKFCQSKNAALAMMWDTFEDARLNYESYRDDQHVKFWIDVKFNTDLGQYVWGQDYEVQRTLWEQSEPNQPQEDSCVTSHDNLWYDESCSDKKPFFCVEGNFDEFIPPTPDPSAPKCENPTNKPFGDKCYWINPKQTVSWFKANEECKKRGMELASIHSKKEVKFLTDLLQKTRQDKKNAWIGLNMGGNGMFRWSDESPGNFLNWDRREPSTLLGLSGTENCVEMMLNKDGKWNDVDCDTELAFVCSTDRILPTVKPTVIDDKKFIDTTTKVSQGSSDIGGGKDKGDDQKPKHDDNKPKDDDNKPKDDDNKPKDDDNKPASDGDDHRDSPDVPKVVDKNKKDVDVSKTGRSTQLETTADDKASGLSGGAIAGVVIGVLALCALSVVGFIFVRSRWPLWQQESILRGNESSKVAFDNALYKQDSSNEKGAVDFGYAVA